MSERSERIGWGGSWAAAVLGGAVLICIGNSGLDGSDDYRDNSNQINRNGDSDRKRLESPEALAPFIPTPHGLSSQPSPRALECGNPESRRPRIEKTTNRDVNYTAVDPLYASMIHEPDATSQHHPYDWRAHVWR